ncbi:MAG: site-specific DNA-methyltransferase [Alphaproteobacteria bacterium]|nr:site-specific DNA-methyltransferase [Alphaproteobacteria bacterium]
MVFKKSQRNKTLDLSVEAGQRFLKKCLTEKSDLSSLLAVENKTILGDAFKILAKLPKGFVDLLIVDPPYNLTKDYEGKKFKAVSDEEYAKYTASWIEKILPLLKPNASVYVCCDWKSSVVIGAVLKKYFHVQNRITWQREKGRGAKTNWKNAMEDIWFATVSDCYTFNLDAVKLRRKVIAPYQKNGAPKDWEQTPQGKFRNTCPSNFWDDICVPYWSMAENTAHPTQKPEKLIAKLILASSNEGDVVFDPFAGSGTTAVTALKLKRRYVAIEQNARYCVFSEKRLEDAKNDTRIQGYENGVFLARNEKFE